MPADPETAPPLDVQCPRVARRFPRVGHGFGIAALLAFFLPLGLACVSTLLHPLLGTPALLTEGGSTLDLFGTSIQIAIGLAVVGAGLVSSSGFAPSPARLIATPDALRLVRGRRERVIPRARITEGMISPVHGARVELRLTTGEDLELDFPHERDGERLLSLLSLNARHRRVSILLGSPNQQIAAGFAALPMSMILWSTIFMSLFDVDHPAVDAGWILAGLLTAAFVRHAARPVEVTVGRDGLRIRRPFRSQWIAYAQLTDIVVSFSGSETELLLLRRQGRPVRLRALPHILENLHSRIREAQALEQRDPTRAAPALERHGRPLSEWRTALGALLHVEPGYRAPPLTPDDLLAALEDPVAPPDRRIGAALALRSASHPEARTRIRIAAESSADDDLRIALEQAAEDELDDTTLERALR
ncbi:hypothetical protein [Chondromyces apiculatus]|uniref:Uncharacterized protein n=1 Tax=Chondromyces apiculatus DSM 436 TaxID=1192034 RepID=A0A017T7H3_9BACT|nr:hypothetical protein [Chondromyces apiculatus]EYF04521.1 Hypothetical protein CAP_4489 [Chondromyces apiculatus DSM 436]